MMGNFAGQSMHMDMYELGKDVVHWVEKVNILNLAAAAAEGSSS